MEKYYEESNLSGIEVKELSRIDSEGDPKPGKYGKYRAGYINRRGYKNTVTYYVKNTREGIKINWEATIGYNEMSWNAFKALRPTKPVTMRVEETLKSDYMYAFRNTERTHYSIGLGLLEWGYARKDSRAGKRLFDILKDGEEHNLVLKIRFLPNSSGPTDILIDDLVSEDWLIR